jgi:lipopolysaccharide export system permease protein
MTTLDKYIRQTVLMAMLLVLLVLASLDLLFTFFDEIGSTDANYTGLEATAYVLHTFPRHLYELLPMVALIGALVGLGILASSNELVVMQASGVPVRRIVWAVMKPTLALMVLGIMLGEFIAPPLELRGEVNKAMARGQEVIMSRYGHWQREDRDFMHFNAIDPAGVLHGVMIYSFDENRVLQSNIFAEQAVYEADAGWRLLGVTETAFSLQDGELTSSNQHYPTKRWQVTLSPEVLKVMIMDADKMAVSDLYQYARRFESQGQDASQYFLSFWKKLLQPLTTGVLVLVAISFIFGPLRDSPMGARVFAAICFGLLFLILQRLLNTVSLVYHLPPLPAVLFPIILSGLFGGWLLRRAS